MLALRGRTAPAYASLARRLTLAGYKIKEILQIVVTANQVFSVLEALNYVKYIIKCKACVHRVADKSKNTPGLATIFMVLKLYSIRY